MGAGGASGPTCCSASSSPRSCRSTSTAFATTFFVAAIVVGLLGGAAAWWLEGHGYLDGQSRMSVRKPAAVQDGCCVEQEEPTGPGAGCTRTLTVIQPHAPIITRPAKVRQLASALRQNAQKMAAFFLAFAGIRYLLIRIIPTGLITSLLGDGNPIWSVPLAAILGIPVYLNTDGSLPLVASFVHGGMNPGAAIAFLITGTLFVTAIATGRLSALWL